MSYYIGIDLGGTFVKAVRFATSVSASRSPSSRT
mgnify:CR=1 FL=1